MIKLKNILNESVEMTANIKHMKNGYAELPDELLKALPNRSEIEKMIDTINSSEEELDPGDPLLYKYDDAIIKGLIALMKKNGITITTHDIEQEDEMLSLYIDVNPTKVSTLQKLGFIEESINEATSSDYKYTFGNYEVELKDGQVFFRKNGKAVKVIDVKPTYGKEELKVMAAVVAKGVGHELAL